MEAMAPGQSIYYTPPVDRMMNPATLEVGASAAIVLDGRKLDEKISEVNSNLNEVVQVMRRTVDRVIERGESLQHLETRANVLEEGAATFEMQSSRLFHGNYCKENMKGILLLSAFISIFFLIFFSKYYLIN